MSYLQYRLGASVGWAELPASAPLPANTALHKILAWNMRVFTHSMTPRLCRIQPQKIPTGKQESCDDKTNWSSEIPIATNFSEGWSFASEEGPLTDLHDLYCTVLQREEPARVFLAPLFPGGRSWDTPVRAQHWSPSAILISHASAAARQTPAKYTYYVYFAEETSSGPSGVW